MRVTVSSIRKALGLDSASIVITGSVVRVHSTGSYVLYTHALEVISAYHIEFEEVSKDPQ